MTDTNQLDASLAAARRKGHPLVTWPGDIERFKASPDRLYDLPTLGNFVPLGWSCAGKFQVRKSPTYNNFSSRIIEGEAYAIISQTESFVDIGIYTKEVVQ